MKNVLLILIDDLRQQLHHHGTLGGHAGGEDLSFMQTARTRLGAASGVTVVFGLLCLLCGFIRYRGLTTERRAGRLIEGDRAGEAAADE